MELLFLAQQEIEQSMPDAPKRDLRTRRIRALLIEGNSIDARFVQWLLARCDTVRFEVTWVERLFEALPIAQSTRCDVVLLDLALEDSPGLDSLLEFVRAVPSMPIVVLTDRAEESNVLEAICHGAQDCLVKGKDDMGTLSRSMQFAIERKAFEVRLAKVADSQQ